MPPKSQDAAKQTAEEITERTQAAMGNYFSWLRNAIAEPAWANTDLNRKLMSYATESVSAYVEHTRRLSQAKNVEDAVKIQTEFVQAQMELFNQRAKELGGIYAKMVTARPFGMST